MLRKVVILSEGRTDPFGAKTANNFVRYCGNEVVALIDSTERGKTAQDLLGHGGAIPVVQDLHAAPTADTLLIGISPTGGALPDAYRKVLLEAIRRGMCIISGLHHFLSDDMEIAALAQQHGARLHDVRKNQENELPRFDLSDACLRVHTVGHDCNVGKMVVALELARGLVAAGVDAKFAATGQTGIMIEGDGCPIDCVVADFIAGATERLVRQNQHHAVVVVEGQASLAHPMYSGVTLGDSAWLCASGPHPLLRNGAHPCGRRQALQNPRLAHARCVVREHGQSGASLPSGGRWHQ